MHIDLSTQAKLKVCRDELQTTKMTLHAVNTLCATVRQERDQLAQERDDLRTQLTVAEEAATQHFQAANTAEKERDDYKRRFERLLDVFTWNEDRKLWTIHPHYHAWINEATEGLELK